MGLMRLTRSVAFYKLNSWSCWCELEYNTRMLLEQQSLTFWDYVQQMTTAVWQFYSYWYVRSTYILLFLIFEIKLLAILMYFRLRNSWLLSQQPCLFT